jgi:hypothetical protein
LKKFAERKEAQARALNKQQSYRWPGEATKFFKAAEAGDWQEASNRYTKLLREYIAFHAPTAKTNSWDKFMMKTYALGSRVGILPINYWPNLRGPQWSPIDEVNGAYAVFQKWDPDLLLYFATNIIASIPTNSIYFGGSDEARYVVSALCKNQELGEPFFTLTQNRLADPTYRKYLNQMYGKKIHISTDAESRQAFSDYMTEVEKRADQGKLKPGENFSSSGGRVRISGMGAMMEINGVMVRQIFDANTNHEFFIEESWPLDWMYPYLVPHGLILKINRLPLAKLDESTVAADRAFWEGVVEKFIGLKISNETPLGELEKFAEQVYLQKDLRDFKGDKRFAANEMAQARFGKLRASIAGVYAWRAQQPGDEVERQRMTREAETAFRQAFALCPKEGLKRYQEWLESEHRTTDAQSVDQLRNKFGR